MIKKMRFGMPFKLEYLNFHRISCYRSAIELINGVNIEVADNNIKILCLPIVNSTQEGL